MPQDPQRPESAPAASSGERIALPPPRTDGGTPVERALHRRRSVRHYGDAPLTLGEAGQLLWATQGITEPRKGLRAAPSAGATFPLEAYLIAGNVEGIGRGVYRYRPDGHAILIVRDGDVRDELAAAALGQAWVARAAAVLALSAEYERTTRRYRERGIRYVHMEAGHAAQNACLQAVALGLGTVVVAAFDDEWVRRVLRLPECEHPLYLVPVGRR